MNEKEFMLLKLSAEERRTLLQEIYQRSQRQGGCLVYQNDSEDFDPRTSLDSRPRMLVRGRTFHVHRVAFILNFGPFPSGVGVLHRCGNRDCVEPSHLEARYVDATGKPLSRRYRTPEGAASA